MQSHYAERLEYRIHPDRAAMGVAAAERVAAAIGAICASRENVRVIFACAPSQDDFLATLVRLDVDWSKVTIFHMDEYVGLDGQHPQSFRQYLQRSLLSKIPAPRAAHLIAGEADPEAECARYSALLAEAPIDLVCLGIGENGHLAFNDPPVADFEDPHLIKVVELDELCRQQQVNDGCFPELSAVPTHALTLTIPALFRGQELNCVVPGPRKAAAVRETIYGPSGVACPSTILRRHIKARLHLDRDSAVLLPGKKTVRFAFVGFRHGHIYDLLERVAGREDAAIVACCEEDEATRRSLAETRRAALTHTDFATMLREAPCDVVAIGDCYGHRGRLAIAALQAGYSVLSDKPLCTSLEELAEIERLSAANGLTVGLQLDSRDRPALRSLRKVIRSGEIGEICAVRVDGQHPLLVGSRPGWYFEPGLHGGTINDIGVHAFDFLPWLTGSAWETTVAARSWNAKARHAPHFEDCAQVVGKLANGAGILADFSYLAPDGLGYQLPQYWRVTVHGTAGMAETHLLAEEITVIPDGATTIERRTCGPGRPGGYLEDFLYELRGYPELSELTTADCLRATRLALEAQAQAVR